MICAKLHVVFPFCFLPRILSYLMYWHFACMQHVDNMYLINGGFFVICLFGGFRPTRELFTHLEKSPLQILTYARHIWSLSNKGSLAYHTYCDAGHVYNGHLRELVRSHTYCRAYSSGDSTTCFYGWVLSRLGFDHPTFHFRGERSNPLRIWLMIYHITYEKIIKTRTLESP